MQGKQLARLVAAVIFIIYSNFFISAIAADVPDVTNLRWPATSDGFRLTYNSNSVPPILNSKRYEGESSCDLYDMMVKDVKLEFLPFMQTTYSKDYTIDATSYKSCPAARYGWTGGWSGSMALSALRCELVEGTNDCRYVRSDPLSTQYRVRALKKCPAAAPFELNTVPVLTRSGTKCAEPLQCEYPFEPEIIYDSDGYIIKTQCVTFCPVGQTFESDYGQCRPKKEQLNTPHCAEKVLNPINARTGAKSQTFNQKLNLPGEFPLNFDMFYSSQNAPELRHQVLINRFKSNQEPATNWVKYTQPSDYKGPKYNEYLNLDYFTEQSKLGYKQWLHPYQMRLFIKRGGYAVLIDNNNNYIEFGSGRNFKFEPSGGVLASNSIGWLYTKPNGMKYQFGLNGLIDKIIHPSGEHHRVTHNGNGQVAAVTHSLYGTAYFTYNDKLLNKITLPGGNEINLNYDDNHNLISITGPTESTAFSYQNEKFLFSLTNAVSSTNGTGSWQYDSIGRAISSTSSKGGSGTVSYGINKVTVAGEENKEIHYVNGLPTKITGNQCNNNQQQPEIDSIEMDNKGRIINQIDELGEQTSYSYDSFNLLASITTKAETEFAQKTKYFYHDAPFYNKLRLILYPNGAEFHQKFDDNGQLLSQKLIDGTKKKLVFYNYYADGKLKSVDGARTDTPDITTYYYHNDGKISAIANAIGHEHKFLEYSNGGFVSKTSDSNASISDIEYDSKNRVTQIKTGERITQYTYDSVGNIQTVTVNGIKLKYTYENGQFLKSIEDLQGNQISLKLDERGNVLATKVIGQSGAILLTHTYAYNSADRVSHSTNAAGESWQYLYDAKNNLVQQIDPNNQSTFNTIDNFSRTTASSDPLNQKTQFTYNNSNQLTQVTDALGRVTHYEYNGFGEVTKRISPDSGTTTYDYDTAGNMLWQRDGRGIKTSYTYDALNRVTSITYPTANENIYFEYDDATPGRFGIGRLTKVTDSSGTQEYFYNQFGDVIQFDKTNSTGTHTSTTRYEYLNSGQLSAIVYPSGRRIEYTYNNLGQVTHVATRFNGLAQQLASNIQYLPFGPLSRLDYGNAKQLTQKFNQDYQLIDKHVTGVYNQKLSYDALTNINSIEDLLVPTQSQQYSYDLVSRLTNATGSYGELAFDYDAIGNRTNKTKDTVQSPYIYQNGKLQEVNGRLYEYDAAGNTVADGKGTYLYNAPGRLTKATILGVDYQYTYNYLGQRVVKKSGDTTRLYHYDLSGLVLAESDGAGNTLVEYVYLNGKRLALIAEQIYYVHANHIDAPLTLTDQNGDIVWQANYTPFGVVNITTNLLSEEMTARFPGQYADSESGLYYNYFRDYDPELGRYIQSDPIGLAGGINTYGYVEGNPVKYTDPLGLAICLETTDAIGALHQRISVKNEKFRYSQSFRVDKGFEGIIYDDTYSQDKVLDSKCFSTTKEQDLEAVDLLSKGLDTRKPYYYVTSNCRSYSQNQYLKLFDHFLGK